jgi:hypothetical protein
MCALRRRATFGLYRFALAGGFRATNSRTQMSAQGREFLFAGRDSSRSERPDVITHLEGQQCLESCHSDRDAADARTTAMCQRA